MAALRTPRAEPPGLRRLYTSNRNRHPKSNTTCASTRYARRQPRRQPRAPLTPPQLLHWQGFGASLYNPTTQQVVNGYIDAARELWNAEHTGGTVRPAIDSGGHWSIADAGAVGRHKSAKSANRELMTPGLSLIAQRSEVETYLSAATLLACAWPNARGHRRWCTANTGNYGCSIGDRCVLDYPEQHPDATAADGTANEAETDILPGYCEAGEAAATADEDIGAYNEQMNGPDPDTGGGGGGGGGTGDTGGGGNGGGLSGGAIAGIVVGSVAVVAGGVALAASSGLLSAPALVGADAEALLI